MAKSYFGTRLSNNIAKTPEGFLVCYNVPIARTGYQDYAPEEVGIENAKVVNGIVKVFRSPEQVFATATIASAEGKDVTDLHPSEWLNTINHSSYSKGHCQNVRKGEGEFADFLIADLFIKDAVLINKIDNGQREVSCGYNHDYAETENGIEQINIIMNHVAIVPNGRAGKEVSIRDAKPNIKKELNKMSGKTWKEKIFGMGMKEFAKDATPEQVAEAMSEKEPEESSKDENAHSEAMGQILESLKAIEARLSKLETSEAAEETPEEAIDALEKELEGKEKEKDDAGLVEPEKLSCVEIPTNPIPGADAALSMLRTMKPIIAAISDPAAKKQACDALTASVKGLMPTPTQKADYGKLLEAQRAKDESAKAAPEDLGKSIKEKYHRQPVKVR